MEITWIEIEAEKLNNNINQIKKLLCDNTKTGVILKANAYGHGLKEVVEIVKNKIDIIFVTDPKDALNIRKIVESSQRIVVMGTIYSEITKELIENDIEIAITDLSYMNWLKNESFNKKLKIHIFIDTGLGREGIRWNDLKPLEKLKLLKNIKIMGIMSHFSNAERKGPPTYAKLQLDRFNCAIKEVKKLLSIQNLEQHMAASAPTILFSDARLDIIRLGISIYGYWTSEESRLGAEFLYGESAIKLEQPLTWKVISKNIKFIPKGDFIGYDCAHLCTRNTKVAVLPVGYYDGYPNLYNKDAWVLVNGRRCRILGNVMMNSIIIDITDLSLTEVELVEATLLGKSGDEQIDANLLANWANSTNYNILTSIGAHIKKVII